MKSFITQLLFATLIFCSLGGSINAQRINDRSGSDSFKNDPIPEITAACSEAKFVLEGNDGDGPDGNIRTFNAEAMSVKVSAFSKRKSDGVWQTAYAGAFPNGLGVTDRGEGNGGDGSHRVDNIGDRHNYLLFEFNTPVSVDKVYLDSVVDDSDITVWIGNANDPYNNHLTLSDAVLAGFGPSEDNDTTSSGARNADINAGQTVGNVIVIAASTSDTTPEDQFKVRYLDIKCPNPLPPCSAGDMKTTGNSGEDGTDGNIRTFSTGGTVSAKASAFSRRKSDGLWETAFLGAFGSGLGVTDRGEGDGSSDRHKVDNIGDRLNYVVFAFNQNVVPDRAYLNSIGADSDITVWIGTMADPFNTPVTLSDPLLSSFGAPETNETANNSPRWADFNASQRSGNVLVIAAKVDESGPEDAFKIEDISIDCPQPKAQVTIIKQVFNSTGGTAATTSFGFTATNFGTNNFSLVDNDVVGPDRIANLNITQFGAANAITITESSTLGWTLSDLVCVETGTQNSTVSLANRKATIIAEPGESIVCTFTNAQLVPSSAEVSVSGRAIRTDGFGISRASVTLANVATGETTSTITNAFGYFSFKAEIGQTYMLSISHKSRVFVPDSMMISLFDDIGGIEFVESP